MRNGFVDNWFDADNRPFGMASKHARGGQMAPLGHMAKCKSANSQRPAGQVQHLRTRTYHVVVNNMY